ncbi:diphthine methyl ester synthase isoform X2 [Tenrec ecaudatus]|uniref:diphthine methyl ester synthase isoform X2 n=1 Tax=Tenrec ecaudatus TaxID=94439 RepID=UPI003F596AC4
MLYLIGLGLGDAKDITVKGLEVVQRCSRVYLEAYTSVLTVGKEALEEFYGRKLILADREEVEQNADNILRDADLSDVAFLVVGDPFGATTHSDLVLRAAKKGIPYRVIHNASIMNAVGCCGLQLYNFGETVSIVFWTDTWRPESFFDKVKKNRQNGMHTLCLLDIKVKEQSLENLIKGRKIYEPPRYMSVNQAAQQLLEIVENQRVRGEEPGGFVTILVAVVYRGFIPIILPTDPINLSVLVEIICLFCPLFNHHYFSTQITKAGKGQPFSHSTRPSLKRHFVLA